METPTRCWYLTSLLGGQMQKIISATEVDSAVDARRPFTDPQWNHDSKPKAMEWKMALGVVLLSIAGGLGVLAIGVVRNTVAPDFATYLGAFSIPLIIGWWGVISLQSRGQAMEDVGTGSVSHPQSPEGRSSKLFTPHKVIRAISNLIVIGTGVAIATTLAYSLYKQPAAGQQGQSTQSPQPTVPRDQ